MDFEYYRTNKGSEAVALYNQLTNENETPVYYSGGTEILTLGRLNLIQPSAVIDLKAIPECHVYGFQGDSLLIGSALSLTTLEELNDFPLLTRVSSQVADRTARNKITIGGNICAQIFYREGVLPFLLADSELVLASENEKKVESIHTRFHERLRLFPGEFLVQIVTQQPFLTAPFYAVKIRQQWQTGYPLLTVAAMKWLGEIRIAFSGLCPFPFRSRAIEAELNRTERSYSERIARIERLLPEPILDDAEGSAEYRLFVLKQAMKDCITTLEREGA